MATASSFKEAPLGDGKIEIGRFTHGYETVNFRDWGQGANVQMGSFCYFSENIQVILEPQSPFDRIAGFPFGKVFQEELGGESLPVQKDWEWDVSIGNDVRIGDGVTIMSGVTIGNGAVVAANSTVFNDVGAYEIWGGNPAVFLQKRFDDELITALEELAWWNLPEELIKEMAPLLSMAPNLELIAGLKSIVADFVTFEDDAA